LVAGTNYSKLAAAAEVARDMENIVTQRWLKATVLIERELDRISETERIVTNGTGFLVGRETRPPYQQTYLVTNKHILGSQRSFGQTITMKLNIEKDGLISPHTVYFTYQAHSFRDHPNKNVDVCAIHVTQVMVDVSGLSFATLDYGSMAFAERIRELDIGQGDDILSLGYPLGYSQGANNLPIVRQGIIATSLLYDLSGEATASPTPLPAFLVDGGVVHGSSGSPIILKPVAGRLVDGAYHLGATLPWFLGILAKTSLTKIGDNKEDTYAGMGLAFRAETVRDTVELFYE
jgi:hypothetical protein